MDTSLQPAAPADRTDLPQDGDGLGLTGPRTNPLLPANQIAQRSNGPVSQSDVDAFISLLDEPGNAGQSDEAASSAHAAGQAASAQAASGSLSEMTLGLRRQWEGHADDADDVTSTPTDTPLTQVNVASAIPNPVAPAAPVSTTGTETRSVQWGSDNIADVVRHVTRTLALRDLDALQSGREVVLQLDATVLPDTALHFRTDGSEATVLLQTGSNDVQQFLDDHLDQLLNAMTAEVPGLRWTMAPEMLVAPRALAPASDASDGSSAGDNQAGRDPGGNASGQSGGQSGNQSDHQSDPRSGPNTEQNEAPSLESNVAFFEAEVATTPR